MSDKSRIRETISSASGLGQGESRIVKPGSSSSAQGQSSRPYRTRGGLYVPPIPEILTGPSAVPGLTSAVISCTVDVAAYMRVKYDGPGDEVISEWTAETSLEPELTISPLEPEHNFYNYRVQCSFDKIELTEWTPVIAENFYTLCNSNIAFSNVGVSEGFLGELSWSCNTNTPCKVRARWRTSSGSYYTPGTYTSSYSTSSSKMFSPMLLPRSGKTYYFQLEAKNQCSYETGWSSEYRIGEGLGGDWEVTQY